MKESSSIALLFIPVRFCRVLRIHIDKLSRLITPSHASLRIPHEYRVEAPWPFAQQQIAYISAYKTPREKVQCVVRCITSIMNLLQMASSRAPAADDLVPVLIFVVIKVSLGSISLGAASVKLMQIVLCAGRPIHRI